MLQMLRDDVGGSGEAAGSKFVSLCQSALRECARQEKTVALSMLLTLQTTIHVGPSFFLHVQMVTLCSLRSHVCVGYFLNSNTCQTLPYAGVGATTGPRSATAQPARNEGSDPVDGGSLEPEARLRVLCLQHSINNSIPQRRDAGRLRFEYCQTSPVTCRSRSECDRWPSSAVTGTYLRLSCPGR